MLRNAIAAINEPQNRRLAIDRSIDFTVIRNPRRAMGATRTPAVASRTARAGRRRPLQPPVIHRATANGGPPQCGPH